MTKINHRSHSLMPSRRTHAGFEARMDVLAYLDAQFHMQGHEAAPTMRVLRSFPMPSVPYREGQEYVQPVRKYPAGPAFGRRGPARQFACSNNCGHPACVQGCSRRGGSV